MSDGQSPAVRAARPAATPSLMATATDLADDALISGLTRVADGIIAPNADLVAQSGVPRSHLNALGKAGFLALSVYEPHRPLTAQRVRREADEILAAADGATWFVASQHHEPVSMVAATGDHAVRDRWLDELTSGRTLAGIAISHLHRAEPTLHASRSGTGFTISGQAAWLTGAATVDAVLVGAATEDDDVVFALVPLHDLLAGGSVRAHSLWGLGATSTVGIRVRDLAVEPESVVRIIPRAVWNQNSHDDRLNTSPALFGFLRAATHHLIDGGGETNGVSADLGFQIAEQGAALRDHAYLLADQTADADIRSERLSIRGAALELAARAALACTVLDGGRGLATGSTVARLVAELSLYAIEDQDLTIRTEILRGMHGTLRAGKNALSLTGIAHE